MGCTRQGRVFCRSEHNKLYLELRLSWLSGSQHSCWYTWGKKANSKFQAKSMGQLLKLYGIVKRQKSRGNRTQKVQRNILKPKMCLLSLCAWALSVLSPWPWAVGGQCWLSRAQVADPAWLWCSSLLSFLSSFYEWGKIKHGNSQVTEGSLVQTWKGAHTILFPSMSYNAASSQERSSFQGGFQRQLEML